MTVLTVAVTIGSYFLLQAFGTANLLTSTVSVATSFVAVYLTWLRSPWYALGYAANDVVLVVLWVLIFLTIRAFSKINERAGDLLIPYILWVTFAAYLNLGVYLLN